MDSPIRIGLPMWANAQWRGSFFPKSAPALDFLAHYASCFTTVEGNTTFHATPDRARLVDWGASVPQGFKFCFKIPKTISHSGKLAHQIDAMNAFQNHIPVLGDKLGPMFLQLPPHYDDLVDLVSLLSATKTSIPLAVELRHADFFKEGAFQRDAFQILRELDIGFVNFVTEHLHRCVFEDQDLKASQAEKPKVPSLWATTNQFAFVRYVGNPNPEQDQDGLSELARHTARWVNQGKTAYIFVHQIPSDRLSPVIARSLSSELANHIESLSPLAIFPAERHQPSLFNEPYL